ncbi:hypothetical protein ACWIID_42370, partial [Streptomyces phaeochromogenes]
MTGHRFPNPPVFVVVDPGPPPYTAPWDLELRGPLDAAALEHLLGELTAGDPGRPAWQHRLLWHGPDHHTLRFTAPQGAPAAFVSGRIADRLTEPPPAAGRPLTPAQHAALAQDTGHRYEAVLIEPAAAPDAGALREALHVVVAAHPQLRSRLDAPDGWHTAQAEDGPAGGQDLLVEQEFTDEAGFAAILDLTGRTLDAHTGVQLRLLLARDRRPAGPRADRLALLVHELAVDAASWRILLDDLTAALAAAAAGRPVPAQPVPDPLAGWVTELRELARDVTETQHWSLVAERRSRAAGAHRPAPVPSSGDTPDTAPANARVSGPGVVRRAGFALDEVAAERVSGPGVVRRA